MLRLLGMPPNSEGKGSQCFLLATGEQIKALDIAAGRVLRNLLGMEYNMIVTVHQMPDDFVTASC